MEAMCGVEAAHAAHAAHLGFLVLTSLMSTVVLAGLM